MAQAGDNGGFSNKMPVIRAENSVLIGEGEYWVLVEVKLPVHPDTTISVDIVWLSIPSREFCAQLAFQWDIVSGESLGSFRMD